MEDSQPAQALRASEAPNHLNDKIHKTSLSQAASQATSHGLNPRSCVTCRKRKVKCDKRHPCTNCTKAHIECVYPAPGRAPRKAKKPPDIEILARLRRLEGVVQSLSGPGDHHDGATDVSSTRSPDTIATTLSNPKVSLPPDSPATDVKNKFGRLVIDEGRSRYVNNSFWANLSNEVEDLKGILNEPSSDDEEVHSPSTGTPSSAAYHGFIFHHSTIMNDLHSYHPPTNQIMEYFQIYVERIDPLVKMLHIPSARILIESVKDNPGKAAKGPEALMFAMYYACITSMSPDDCLAKGWDSRAELLAKYRYGVEQALMRANFLVTEEIVVLQAFIIFLMTLRRNEDARFIWSLCGLVVRIAMTLGLHRDGTNFGLSPFDTDMRRRTWWEVSILDIRASQDHGCDSTIPVHGFDTELPLNINDEDIDPSMTEPPEERIGCSEMTFSLIRFEVAKSLRKLDYVPLSKPTQCDKDNQDITLQDKERWIEECHRHLEDKYLKYCDMNVPIYWVTATVSRLIMAKMWLVIYHPFQRLDGGKSLLQGTKDRLFITSLESVEYALLIETEVRTVKWGWLFKTYIQWHALAFLLSELCVRTKGPTVVRAWRAIDAVLAGWGTMVGGEKKGQLWKPLRKLMAKARAAREQELMSDQGLETGQPLVDLKEHEPAKSMYAEKAQRPGWTQGQPIIVRGKDSDPAFTQVPQATAASGTEDMLLDPNSAINVPLISRSPSAQDAYMDIAPDNVPSSSQFFAAQTHQKPSKFDKFFQNQFNTNRYLIGDWFIGNNDLNIPSDLNTEPAPHITSPDVLNSNLESNPPIDPILFPPDANGQDFPSKPQQPNFQTNALRNGSVDDADMEWSDWDDMVREYQLESNQAGTTTTWHRQPVLGETWL